MPYFNKGSTNEVTNEHKQVNNKLSPSEAKLVIERLKSVEIWGAINRIYPLLDDGAWFVDADLGSGIIISKKAANENLSSEAARLGITQSTDYLAYSANKSMDIVLLDSVSLRQNWFEVLGLEGEKAELEKLRIERGVNLNWPIYFEPIGLRPASHGYSPNPRYAAQRARLDHANHYRSIGHQDIIDKVYIDNDLMLKKDHQALGLIILESFDGRMYSLPSADYRPDEGYQMITDYPNLTPINLIDDYDAMERSQHWVVDALSDILGDPVKALTEKTIYEKFYQLGVDTGFKTDCRVNQRVVHEGLDVDVARMPATDMQTSATVVDMVDTIKTAMGFLVENANKSNIISDEMKLLAFNGFISGIMSTPYPDHYSAFMAVESEIMAAQAELNDKTSQLEALLSEKESSENQVDGFYPKPERVNNSNASSGGDQFSI